MNSKKIRQFIRQFIVLFGLGFALAASASATDLPKFRKFKERVVNPCANPVDLRQPGFSMAGVATLHQGDSLLCAQHTSVLLMQAFLNTQTGGSSQVLPSPGALAIESAAKSKFPFWFPIQNTTDPLSRKNLRWGGNVCPLIDFARKNEACNDPFLQDQSVEGGPKTQETFQKLYDEVMGHRSIKRKIRRLKSHDTAQKLYEILLTGHPVRSPDTLPSIAQIQHVLDTTKDPYKILREISLQGCAQNRTSGLNQIPQCSMSLISSDEDAELDAIDQVAELLDQGPQKALPVPFAFCYELYTEGNSYKNRHIWEPGCGSHWSLIVGKKIIDGQCHFLVRNSYGKDETYSKDWIVDDGDIWIRADTLMRATSIVEWLQ